MAEPGSVKGHHIKFAKEYLLENYPEGAYDKIIALMDEKNRKIAAENILSVSWIPEETWGKFLIAFDRLYGQGDYKLCNNIGVYIGKKTMPLFYQIFMKFGNPHFVIQRANHLWKQMHNSGSIEILELTANSGTVRIRDKVFPHKAFCEFVMGFSQGILELCGAKKFSYLETQCAAEGAPCCDFRVKWQ